jgi:hypothetical protein
MTAEENTQIQRVVQATETPVHLVLTRNAKGGYQWEISVYAGDENEALQIVLSVDEVLTKKYYSNNQEVMK